MPRTFNSPEASNPSGIHPLLNSLSFRLPSTSSSIVVLRNRHGNAQSSTSYCRDWVLSAPDSRYIAPKRSLSTWSDSDVLQWLKVNEPALAKLISHTVNDPTLFDTGSDFVHTLPSICLPWFSAPATPFIHGTKAPSPKISRISALSHEPPVRRTPNGIDDVSPSSSGKRAPESTPPPGDAAGDAASPQRKKPKRGRPAGRKNKPKVTPDTKEVAFQQTRILLKCYFYALDRVEWIACGQYEFTCDHDVRVSSIILKRLV
jgi:hypothetical protein